MSDMRELIGLPYDSAKDIVESMGLTVKHIANTRDARHRYDTELVVRVKVDNNTVILTTAEFALKTE